MLGQLEALQESRQVPLGGDRQRALLALLLLHPNETLSADRLIDGLWGEQPPATAAKTLQVHVSRLRKALAAAGGEGSTDILLTREHGYAIRVAPGSLDVERFEALIEEGRAEVAGGRPERAAAALEEALSLWRGPPLADLAGESFAQQEIARLEQLKVSALEGLIETKLALGGHAEVVPQLERLVAEHPYRERLHAQLMLALYRCDRQAEALEAYHGARRRLVGDLGIEPGERLRELERAILDHDPSLAAPAQRAGGPLPEFEPASRGSGDFVGRARELAELRTGLQDAIAGRGSLFLLVGEPGIGKTRLAEEVMAEAREARARVLVGRCWEAGGAPTYWPWMQALRMYLEGTEPQTLRAQLGTDAGDVAYILPELREMFGDLPVPSEESEAARFRLFESMSRFLSNAASARPLVVVLDDLHAADEPSLLLLRFVATALGGSGILVVGTYRDVDPMVRDPLAATLAELGRERVTHRIELAGLTEADVGRYIELAVGVRPDPQLVAAMHAETEGNPFFVGEVVRLLAAEGRLEDGDPGALATLGIPQGVREVIGRRLGRLPEDCRRLLGLASVLGREFRLDALERLAGLEADRLLDLLDEAVDQRLLTGAPAGPGHLRFAHALIRETLYDQLSAPRRLQLHRRLGEALEDLYAPDPEPHLAELAYHFFQAGAAGDVGKAVEYSRRAADRAMAVLAYEEGARFYQLALQSLELGQRHEAPTRCDLLIELGDALAKAGNMQQAKQRFIAGAEIARSAALSEQLARAALGYGGRHPFARAGPDTRLVPLLEEALSALGDEQSILRARVMGRLAAALRDQPSLEPRASLSREALDIARRLGDEAALADTLISHFTATWTPEIDRLLQISDEVWRLAVKLGDAERLFQASFLDYVASLTVGDAERVSSRVDQIAASNVLKQPALRWWSLAMRSVWALLRGDFAEAERLTEEALEVGQRAQNWDAGFSYRIALFALRREQGRLDEIDELIRDSVQEYAGYRSFRCLVPLIDCELARRDEASRALDELAADDFSSLPRDSEWLFCLSILSEVAVELGDTDRGAVLFRLLLPYENLFALASGEVSLGCVARYLGMLAALAENWDGATRHFENALVLNARMHARPWIAHSQADYARMLLARGAPGDRDEARSFLTRALATCEALGMPAAASKAEALYQAATAP